MKVFLSRVFIRVYGVKKFREYSGLLDDSIKKGPRLKNPDPFLE